MIDYFWRLSEEEWIDEEIENFCVKLKTNGLEDNKKITHYLLLPNLENLTKHFGTTKQLANRITSGNIEESDNRNINQSYDDYNNMSKYFKDIGIQEDPAVEQAIKTLVKKNNSKLKI